MLQFELNNKYNLVNFPDEVNLEDKVTKIDISRMEDVLTSNVFGIIKNIDIKVINMIIKESGINISFKKKPHYEFWYRFNNGTEPDIIIYDDKNCIVIEVKYNSDFNKGNDNKKPQIIREIEGAKSNYKNHKIYYLAISKNNQINWRDTVLPHYYNLIDKYNNMLFHISWNKIYKILKDTSLKLDKVSKYFLNDLIEYLKSKGIGFVTSQIDIGKRDLKYFFGDEINDLETFISNDKISYITIKYYEIYLDQLNLQNKQILYKKIINFIEDLKNKNYLKTTKNNIQTNSVTSDLLLIDDFKELQDWTNFITYLYSDEYVNLNGISDISVLLRMVNGNYANKDVSLFTYYKMNRKISISRVR